MDRYRKALVALLLALALLTAPPASSPAKAAGPERLSALAASIGAAADELTVLLSATPALLEDEGGDEPPEIELPETCVIELLCFTVRFTLQTERDCTLLLAFYDPDDGRFLSCRSQPSVPGQSVYAWELTENDERALLRGFCLEPETLKPLGASAVMDFSPEVEHQIHVEPAVAPSCASGWTEGQWCEVCGKVFVEREELPPNGEHIFRDGLCANCGEKEPLKAISLPSATENMRPFDVLEMGLASRTPATAGLWDVFWFSYDSSVVSIDANGRMTALRPGTTTVTAVSGGVNASCTVKVGGTKAEAAYRYLYQYAGEHATEEIEYKQGVATLRRDVESGALILRYAWTEEQTSCNAELTIPADMPADCAAVLTYDDGTGGVMTGPTAIRPSRLSRTPELSFSVWVGSEEEREHGAKALRDSLYIALALYERRLGSTLYSFVDLGFTALGFPPRVPTSPPVVTGLTPEQTELALTVGETAAWSVTVAPQAAASLPLAWYSSNDGVVTVENGTLTARTPGTATVYAAWGRLLTSCRVTVLETEETEDGGT